MASKQQWLRAQSEKSPATLVELGSRIVLQLKSAVDVPRLTKGRPLELSRTLQSNVFILQAPEVWTALREAQRLAQLPEVLASHPITRRQIKLHGPYAYKPNDPYFGRQWNLENRNANDASSSGAIDLNVRAAWPIARGHDVIVAIADDGVELSHPELAPRVQGMPHFNFETGETNGLPAASDYNHATAVAGLVAAEGGNFRGMVGMAPEAKLASWVIFYQDAFGDDSVINDEKLMDMFQYRSNIVSVQNHSWGNASTDQLGPSAIERIAISNAVTFGRGGKGVIMVRSAGNNRENGGNVNDDGYPSDPFVIAVAAARFDGRAASYSNPGASLLVATPSGDDANGFPSIFTTDRQGALGFNRLTYTNDFADYGFDSSGFSGTSASAPQVSGIAALILSANTNLTYRDVQQILLHSARHFDLADPDLRTNGAGFRFSHNVGFGVPDAGQAVLLARSWTNRPPLTNVTITATNAIAIPDDGLRVLISGPGVPANLSSLPASPSLGPHADAPTSFLPLVHVGQAADPITTDLTGKAALIQRRPNLFTDKIEIAAQAGASLAIIYNDRDGDKRLLMGGTDFVPIPAVFISQNDGEALRDLLLQETNVLAQVRLNSASYSFEVGETLLCEHVGLRVTTDHTRRGDLRITLVSPQGTRSVLQRENLDTSSGPVDWTYYSTFHFYESSAGTWKAFVTDEVTGETGSVLSMSLTILGVPIVDSDRDGLDDRWEMLHFKSLAFGPKDDPDGDGYSNAREQIMGTDPLHDDLPFQADLSLFDERFIRLSWPSNTNRIYRILLGNYATAPLSAVTNLSGRFPVTEWFTSYTNLTQKFFRVREFSP